MGEVFGSIVSPAIEFLLKSAVSLINEEIGLIRNFKKDLNELEKSLKMIQAFLNDAENKQVTSEAVKLWLENLEAVAFDADNVLDELNYEVHRRKMDPRNKLKKKVRAYISTRKMALDIKCINKELNSITEKASSLGLQSKLSASDPAVGSNLTLAERETASNPEPFVFGRETNVSNIVEILTQNDQQEVFSILPIFGMGGLGKTTLAKSVFHDTKIKAHYEKRIWVYVSENFDEITLLKKILESLMGSSKDDFRTKEALLAKLEEILEGKKYLLVLDDVWTEETMKWGDFVDILSSITSVKGNGIIVTTRRENVALMVGTTPIEKLEGLRDEDCWSIIKEKAFKKGCVTTSDFEDIGRKIANKCQGLPLAAKVVGGVLRGKPIEKWHSIEQNELSSLGKDVETMKNILKLSFDYLPTQSLKKCFAFCAIFPKGYQIQKSMLIHLWMAEGFLQSDDMETLGDEYFDLLLYNSLLQVGERDYDGNIAYYTMHDLVYDVAFSILNESNPVRCIYTKFVAKIPIAKARKIRSLIFEGEVSDENMLSDFKCLRGLVLIGDGNKQLPKIEHLKHLRYLDVLHTSSGCSPELMGNLYLLQTCKAKVTSKEFPEAFKKLINLRHVYVECIEEMRAETQLRREVVASPCLEDLEAVGCQKPTSAASHFPNLKTLYLYGMHSSWLLENLLVNITSLTRPHFEELEGLVCLPDVFFRNNQNLTYLRLSKFGNLRRLPPKFGVSLKQVEIIGCDQLEGLPDNPHCLNKLTLRSCPNIKSIPYNPSGGSPSLRELIITDCGGLTELPIELLESCASLLEYVWLEGLASVTNMGMVIACLQKMPRLTSLRVDLRHLPTDDFPPQTVGSFGRLHDLWITCGMEMWQRLEDLIQHLNALRKLTLSSVEIGAVPEWLGKLLSLRELHLERCWKLWSLPSEQALKHLTRLTVYDCRLLDLRRDDDNSEWHKVSHIAEVLEYQVSLGSNAGSAFEFLLQNLTSLCKEKISLIRNFRKDLDELKESLKMIQDFLNDAEEKQVTDEAVKLWLMNLEAVAVDADNVLDELNYEVHLRKVETANKMKKKVQALFSTRKMALDIRSINEKLNSIKQKTRELGLQNKLSAYQKARGFGLQNKLSAYVPGVGSDRNLAERETASNPEPFVFGRETNVLNIVEILTQNDQQEIFFILPIVGMGGLGKTTLAKSIFHDTKIKAHYEKLIWVYVSENFDEMTLLKKILESLMGSSKDDFRTKEALLAKLGEILEGKKYLLVLDDVWTEEMMKWDDFVDILSSITSVKGNGIIVTTRIENVALMVGTTHIEKLEGLRDEDCWSIIKEKAFKKGCVITSDFEDIGRKIANKCRGLPLAAKVVGGLLRGKSKEEWYSIEKTKLSNLGEDGNTMKNLKLSFDNLPSQSLKKYFAFCAIFPKGYWIQRSMVIHLWMAEGLLQGDDMETLGDKYFDLLLHNSLLQVGLEDDHGRISYYTMHDLVWDLAFSVLYESGPVRYIYLKSIIDIPKWKARNVRLLIFEGEVSNDNMLSDFKYLRGLVLIGHGNTSPPKIDHLIHLRYLDILDTSMGCSPKLIGNLYLLWTLRAKVAPNGLPEALKKLINLRHVYVEGIEETRAETRLSREVVASPCQEYLELLRCQKSTSSTSHFPILKTLYINGMHSSSPLENLLINTTSLTELQFHYLEGLVCLPDTFFQNNQNLTYFRIYDCENLRHLPPHFGVSLTEVNIAYCPELEGLPEIPHCLDKLFLRECPNIKSIPYNPSGCSPSLRELIITDCGGLTELPIELLESCASLLEYVWLEGLASVTNMGMVIACLQKMSRLTSLRVDLRHLPTDDFPPQTVGSFGRLRDLWITCGMEMWQRLEDLIQHLNALRKLTLSSIEIGAVPEWLGKLLSLQELHLERCRKLRRLPSKQALRHLTKLTVYACPRLNLQEDDGNSEWHKVSHIAEVLEYQVSLGSNAGSAVEFLLQNLTSLCKEKISLIRNFRKDLDELKESLKMIQDFLNDAKEKQVTDEAVKLWLMNLEAVAVDADNVLDELNYEVHLRKVETANKMKKKVQALFSTRKMALDIRSINEKLNSIKQKTRELGLQNKLSAYQKARWFGFQNKLSAYVPGVGSDRNLAERETASNPESFVFGRETNVSNIVEILTQSDQQEVFSILPIFGMGGLGKTTLAKSIFHDTKIKAHYEKRIWVYVSEAFDERTLLRKILESLMGSSKDDFRTKEALLAKLGEILEGKKYLLVLDDVWTEEKKKLDDFADILSSITSVKGNGIIVTTRSEIVASIVGTIRNEKLEGLSDEDCWSIIKEKTFGNVISLDFEDIGRRIANKCRGLPLAAKVVGGLLRGKSKEEWYSIEKTELSNLGEDGNTMKKILKMSFDNLPSQSLKKCFAFCAIFPKGYWIQRSMVIHLWMAEVLQGDDMETLGDKYFDLLLHNSLLQVGLQDDRGRISYYTMHDLVWDLAFSVLHESGPVRYIYLESITDIPKWKARNVRSLIFEGEVTDENMLSDFKYLRGLVLIGHGNTQPPKIEHLIHLRYLDISETSMVCSPKLIGNLYYLRTIRAKVASNELPEALKKLTNLRHVYVEESI